MKTILSCFIAILTTSLAMAESGLQAMLSLRTGGIVEVSGIHGQDQPTSWRVTRMEQMGPMDHIVVNGRVVNSRPSRRQPAGPEILQARLKFDSTHAFTRANVLAQRSQTGFDSANFRLRSNGHTQIWDVQLVDFQNNMVGSIQVSAYSGEVQDSRFYPAATSRTGYSSSNYNNNSTGGYGYGSGSNSGSNSGNYSNYNSGYNNSSSGGNYRSSNGYNSGGNYNSGNGSGSNYNYNSGYSSGNNFNSSNYNSSYGNSDSYGGGYDNGYDNGYGGYSSGNYGTGYGNDYSYSNGNPITNGIMGVGSLAKTGVVKTVQGVGSIFRRLATWVATP